MEQLVIKKEDLKNNIKKIKEYVKTCKSTEPYTIIGVVKGNGYGFDLIQFSKFLINNGIDYLAVATLDEAIKIAEANICKNILLMSVLNNTEDLEKAIKNNIILTVDSLKNAKQVNEFAKNGYNIRVHIKIDTGFGRYGFIYNDVKNILNSIDSLTQSNVQVEGIFSHLSDAYRKNNAHTKKQFEAFEKVLGVLEARNINIKLKHICNSPAFLNYPEMHLNCARLGSALVGRVCAEKDIGLKRIGELEISVAEVKKVPKNFSISYLDSYRTKRESEIAIIPIGFLNGFNVTQQVDMFRTSDKIRRIVKNVKSLFKKQKLTVIINNKQYDIIGTIGMYHTIVDVTNGDVKQGDIAHLDVSPFYISKEIRREYR